jgi:hypothetical protein
MMKKGAASKKWTHKKPPSKALTNYKKKHLSYPKKQFDNINRQEYSHNASRKPTPWPQICPHSVFVSLRYVDALVLDVPVAGFLTQVYSANGCYDPWITGTGHQPCGIDEWLKIYNNYRVHSSKMTAKPIFINAPYPALTGAWLHIDGQAYAAPTAFDKDLTFLENYGGVNTFATGNPDASNFIPQAVTRTFSAKRDFQSPNWKNDPDYWGNSGFNPNTQYYYHMYLWSMNGQNPGALNVYIEVTYNVEVFMRKPLQFEE